MLCTSGFVNVIMFSFNGPDGCILLLQLPRCSVMHGLTPLLHGIGCPVLDDGS